MLELKTERLIITVFTPEMAQAVHENSLDADNRRFLPDEVFETKEDAAETVAYLMAQYGKTDGPLVYPVLLRNGTPIGHVQAEGQPQPQHFPPQAPAPPSGVHDHKAKAQLVRSFRR